MRRITKVVNAAKREYLDDVSAMIDEWYEDADDAALLSDFAIVIIYMTIDALKQPGSEAQLAIFRKRLEAAAR
jgi:hypothetical protein